jgi:hypothetical protein
MTDSLEVLDVFGDCRYLENGEFPSWVRDWRTTKEEFTSVDLGFEWGKGRGRWNDSTSLSQEHTPIGHLELKGVTIATKILALDSNYLVNRWPNDVRHFIPFRYDVFRYNEVAKSILVQFKWTEIIPSHREEYEWAYIFPSIVVCQDRTVLEHRVIPRESISEGFTHYLTEPEYAYADVLKSHTWGSLRNMHFSVPRSASLGDIVVAFSRSTQYYLLRPLVSKLGYYRYLGPVVGFTILDVMDERLSSATSQNLPVADRKSDNYLRHLKEETFTQSCWLGRTRHVGSNFESDSSNLLTRISSFLAWCALSLFALLQTYLLAFRKSGHLLQTTGLVCLYIPQSTSGGSRFEQQLYINFRMCARVRIELLLLFDSKVRVEVNP